jgi:hypothetical protein
MLVNKETNPYPPILGGRENRRFVGGGRIGSGRGVEVGKGVEVGCGEYTEALACEGVKRVVTLVRVGSAYCKDGTYDEEVELREAFTGEIMLPKGTKTFDATILNP